MSEFRCLRRLPGAAVFSLLPLLALAPALSGCAGSQAKTEAMVQSRLEAQANEQKRVQVGEYQSILAVLRQTSMCVTTAEQKPEFKPLLAHGSNDGDNPPTTARLVDNHKPGAKDIKLIDAFLAAMAPCKPGFGPIATPANRNIARVIGDTWNDQQALYGALRERKLSWGAFARATRANSDKLSGALKALRLTNEG